MMPSSLRVLGVAPGNAGAAEAADLAGRASPAEPHVTGSPFSVNGQPGAPVPAPDGRLLNVLSLDSRGGVIQAVRSVINPDKLQHLGPLMPVTDVRALSSKGT